MASDSLREVGKYIRKTGKDADRALKRPYPIQPRLERVRDIFDSTTAFEMQVDTTGNDRRVLLDLNFTLPPPIRGCKSGCIFSKCGERGVGGECGITDTFTRSVASGWGVSDMGLDWTIDSGTGSSVNGSQGVLSDVYSGGGFALQTTMELFGIVSRAVWSFEAVVTFSIIDANEPFIVLGSGTADVTLQPSTVGESKIQLGITELPFIFTAGVAYRVHFQRDGDTTSHLNVWQDGVTEPSGWMIDSTLPTGSTTSFFVYYQPSAGRFPTVGTVMVDNLDIASENNCGLCGEDNFNRVSASSNTTWGVATFGNTWFAAGGGGGAIYEVDGTKGTITQDGLATSGTAQIVIDNIASSNNFTMLAKFQWAAIPSDVGFDESTIGVSLLEAGALELGISMNVNNSASGGSDTIALFRNGGSTTYHIYPWTQGAWYWLKWYRAGGDNKVKIWLDSSSEPGSWTIEESGDSSQIFTSFGIITQGPSLHPQTFQHWWDEITFTCTEAGTTSSECFVLNHPYTPGSVSVMGIDSSQINETNPEAGEVCVQGLEGLTEITVCYMYTEGCT